MSSKVLPPSSLRKTLIALPVDLRFAATYSRFGSVGSSAIAWTLALSSRPESFSSHVFPPSLVWKKPLCRVPMKTRPESFGCTATAIT